MNCTGKQLSGEEAPLASQLDTWLEANPGWEPVEDSDESEESGDDDGDNNDDKDNSSGNNTVLMCFLNLETS